MRLWLLAVSILVAHRVDAQSVRGVVRSAVDGSTIPGVLVRSGSVATMTDAEGEFRLELPTGIHVLTFSCLGFDDYVDTVRTDSGRTPVLNVQLVHKAELLNTIVVTTGKFDQKLGEVTVSMEVLRPEFIEKSNNTSIEQTLDRVPGVGMIDGQPNIRGGAGYSYGAGSRVMVLVDGLPILSGDAGFPSWGFLPLENISQVEVIKGASSALYGSAAMNGVINLRTAYPTSEPETRLRFFSGVYMNPRGNVTDSVASVSGTDTAFVEKSWWGNVQPTFSGFSASHRQKFGHFDLVTGTYWLTEDNYKMGDYNRKGRFHLNTRYRPARLDRLSFGLNGAYERSQSASFFLWKGSGADLYKPFPNTITNNDGHKFTLDPFITYFGERGSRHKLLTRWYSNHNTTDRRQSVLSDLYFAEYQFQRAFDAADLVLTSGATMSYATVVAELYIEDSLFSTNTAFYVQADQHLGSRLNLSAGARYEINKLDSVAESRPVFRFGANYRVARGSFVRASFGQGYRFPTIAEKFVRTDVGLLQIYPNQNLKSETGWSAEVGLRQAVALSGWRGMADLAFFWQQYQDMMEFTFGGTSGLFGFQSINVGETRIRGVEVSLNGTGNLGPVPLQLMAGYTYIDPTFLDFDSIAQVNSTADYNVLKYRFRHTAKFDVETSWRGITLGAAMRYYSFMEAIDAVFVAFIPSIGRFRNAHDNGDWVVDARLGLRLGDAHVWLIVSNLLNNEYTVRPALIEPPRNMVVRLNYDIKWKKAASAM